MTTESDNVVVTELAPVATPTVAQVLAMPIVVPISVSPGEKPEKFSGLNFKRWQQKMLFYLTTLNLARFLTEDAPKLKEDEHDIQKTAKELWESLDRKYKTEDAGAKNLLWVASSTIRCETFQVAAIIEKLPPAWKDFKNYLKHKRKEMSIEDLIIRLRIEEDNRRSEKKGAHTLNEAKTNFVEHGQSSKAKTNNNKGKGSKLEPKGGISKKPKFQGKCFNCAVVSEVNLVGSNPKEWWIDTGATRHVCSDKKMFSTFEPIENGEKCSWGTLPPLRSRVKNLVSGSLLNNHGFRLVFESNKFVLSKSGMYVGKGYMSDGMWKLNVMTIIKSNMNKASTSTYMLESSNLWHAPYSPQSNGVAERKNRTLKEMMNAMLISSSLPQNMWGEAILTANYLLNKVPKKKAEKTSYELWKGRKPSYTYLRMWGCLAKVAVPPPKKNTIMESRNASFFEDVFPCKSKEEPSSSKRMLESQDQNEEVEVEPRRSKRVRTEKSFGPDFLTFMFEGEPQTFKEAVNSIEGLMWKEAIKSEIDSILQNHTWELVDLPPSCKPLSSKWIFKRKMKVDGSIDKYKARLVIKGYRQTEGLDYFDTYSPVTRINSIRMVLAIAALRNLEIHQMDVKTAFLNGDLDEEIYMEQPEGFQAPGQEKKDTEHGYVIVCLYVNDMLIVGSDDKMITSTKNMLNSRFDMKDMGLADVILGIKIKRTSDELILSQSHYVDKILGKFDKDNSGVARTPVDVTLRLSKNKSESVSQVEYSRVIGSLMYLMSCTRPDIAYAISKLSRYTSNPGAKHWQGIIRVLKYLRFTRDYGLHYTRYPAVLEGYSDANWISNVKDSKSHSGYVFTLGGAAMSWKSSKQTVIARSTMESEFIALDKCGEEAEWLRHFLEDIPRWSKPVPPICIHCDSQSAIGRAQSNMYNGKSRHIHRRHNTIRQLLSTGVISVDYVKSKDNIADPLTKGLNRELVEKSSRGMGLKPIRE
ncbi:Retrovirus-related Pol polyprotein from transposon TNT 1-94 [Vitis vinifera]|uniref:Retrovirus-related Pol polyprotein from transposon TNT 1-94 n=1 Tax=Vitis vinifera TaxID=29760 RepID=A0A438C1L4_VITVI|nr:Retrovirus-related Pol polyprotein from transposon TNT 1-94 [Vitis vinifera]